MDQELVYGRNPVRELLQSGKELNKVLLQSEGATRRNQEVVSQLRERGIPYQLVERATLDRLAGGGNHQGIIAYVAAREYATVEQILALARAHGEDPLILMLDEVEDPRNLGAIIRTVHAVGAHGVIIPKRRSVALTATVAKTSAGAVEHVLVARVANLVQTIRDLQTAGCWVTGAEADGKDVFTCDLRGPRVLVVGGEGKGLSRLVRQSCDEIVSLPMQGKVNSLNASVAASVLLYEIRRQRCYRAETLP